MQHLFELLRGASTVPFYLLVIAAAAAQNVIPIPITDVMVLFAAFLMEAAHESALGVFFAAWMGNVGLAAIMYGFARYYRVRFAEPRFVRWLLRGKSRTEQRNWEPLPVLVSCFLPVRPLLPVLAGLADVAFWRVLMPITLAAGAWYGGLTAVGAFGGHNFNAVMRTFALYRTRFGILAVVLTVLAVAWWWIRRRRRIK